LVLVHAGVAEVQRELGGPPVGKLTNNPDLEAEGKVEKVAGKVQSKIGQVKKVLGT
jgi:hypothetical protein